MLSEQYRAFYGKSLKMDEDRIEEILNMVGQMNEIAQTSLSEGRVADAKGIIEAQAMVILEAFDELSMASVVLH